MLLTPACTSDKTVVMTGRRSEGLTTSTVTFYSDGSYSIDDETFLSDNRTNGKYSIKDSLITLTVLNDNDFLKSSQLLLRKDIFNNLILYQLDNNKEIDTTLLEFTINVK